MRGCRIRVSLEMFLNVIGLQHASGIQLYNVLPIQDNNVFELFLVSEDNPDMPELGSGDNFPEATIECERMQSRIKIREP